MNKEQVLRYFRTQDEAAEIAGISRQTIVRNEHIRPIAQFRLFVHSKGELPLDDGLRELALAVVEIINKSEG